MVALPETSDENEGERVKQVQELRKSAMHLVHCDTPGRSPQVPIVRSQKETRYNTIFLLDQPSRWLWLRMEVQDSKTYDVSVVA